MLNLNSYYKARVDDRQRISAHLASGADLLNWLNYV